MDDFFIYLLKVSAGTALLYLGFVMFFSKDTFYLRNRIFLILILILPLIIPVISMPVKSIAPVHFSTTEDSGSAFLPGPVTFATTPGVVENSFNYFSLLFWGYLTICGFFLLRLIFSIIATCRIINKGVPKGNGFPVVITTDLKVPPFSFFPYIIIPEEEYSSESCHDLLKHESAHVRQGHTFDLLLCEFFVIFQWFNPFAWLVKRSMKLNHEYLADRCFLKLHQGTRDYQLRLLHYQTSRKHIGLAHSFSSLIKNRIIMINRKETRKIAALKNLIVLPLFALAAFAFAAPELHSGAGMNIYKPIKGIVLNEQSRPMYGVVVTISGSQTWTATDQNGEFILPDVPQNALLSFDFYGFKQVRMKPEFSKDMIINMQKDFDKIPSDFKIVPPGEQSQSQGVPLIIIDGVEKDSKTFSDPNTYFTVKFIKDKEATSIYGEKGKNGVLLITLKK